MSALAGLADAVLGLVRQYGYAAVFVYMVLETAFLLHYVPSEVVVPFAASQLVHDPVSFAAFVADTTAGATVGSVLAYVVFGRYGRLVLERYGRYVHVTEHDIDRSTALFARYGESSVAWGRLLPFVRAFISIPAGLADMDFRRFVAYSAGGALLFNTALTYLVYTAADETSPLGAVVAVADRALAADLAYVDAHTRFVIVATGTALLVALAAWLARDWLRENPALTKAITLHAVRALGLLVCALFVLGALTAPANAFAVVTSLWNDPLVLVRLGFTERVALLLVGLLAGALGLLAYELGTLVELTALRDEARERLSR
ncbi:MAG: DedA family protein [Halarchaeum sp.]